MLKIIKENIELKKEVEQLENKLIDYEWVFKNILECASNNPYSGNEDKIRDYRLNKIKELVKDVQEKYLKEVK